MILRDNRYEEYRYFLGILRYEELNEREDELYKNLSSEKLYEIC